MSEDNDQLVEVVSNEKEDIATVRVLEQRAEVAALLPKDAVEAAASDEAKAAGEAPARTAAVTEVRKDYRLAHPEAAVDVDKEQEGGNTTGDVTKFNSCKQAHKEITGFNDCTRDLDERETQKNNACQPNSNCVKQFKKKFKKVCKKCDKNYSKCVGECVKQGFCDS